MKRTHALFKTASWLVWLGAGVFVHESSLAYPMHNMHIDQLQHRNSDLTSRAYTLVNPLLSRHYKLSLDEQVVLHGSSSIIPDPFTTQEISVLSPVSTGENTSWVYYHNSRDLSLITADSGVGNNSPTTVVVDSKFLDRLNQEHKKTPFHQYSYKTKGKSKQAYNIPLSKRGAPLPVDSTGKELLDPTHTQNSLADLDALINQYEKELVTRLEQQKFKAGQWVKAVSRKFTLRTSFKKNSANPIYSADLFATKTSSRSSLSLTKLSYVQLLAIIEQQTFTRNVAASQQQVTVEYASHQLKENADRNSFNANPKRKLTSVQLSSSKIKEAEAKATASLNLKANGCDLVSKDKKAASPKTKNNSNYKNDSKNNQQLTPCNKEKISNRNKSAYPYLFSVIKDYNPDANEVLARITAQIEEQERKLAAQTGANPTSDKSDVAEPSDSTGSLQRKLDSQAETNSVSTKQESIENALASGADLESIAAQLSASEIENLLKRVKVFENRHYVVASSTRKFVATNHSTHDDTANVPLKPEVFEQQELTPEAQILGYEPMPGFPSKQITLPPNLHQVQDYLDKLTNLQSERSTKLTSLSNTEAVKEQSEEVAGEAMQPPTRPKQESHEKFGVKPGETLAVTQNSEKAIEESSRLAAQSYNQLHYGHNHYPSDGHHHEEVKPVTEIKTLTTPKQPISRLEEKTVTPDIVVQKSSLPVNPQQPSSVVWKKDGVQVNEKSDSADKDSDKDIKKILNTGVVSIDKIKALEPGKAIVLDQNNKINTCVAYREFYENVNKLFTSNKIQTKLPASLDKYESFVINDRIKKYAYSLDDNTRLNLYQENDECLVRILAYTLFETDRSKLQIQETPANKKRYATVSAMVTGAAYPSQSSSILTAYILKSRDLFVTSGSEVYELYGYEYQVEIYPSYMSLMITNKSGLIAEEQTSLVP